MTMRFGCCCDPPIVDPCIDCEPVANLCCIKVTRSDSPVPRYLKHHTNCPSAPWTELCGQAASELTPTAFCGLWDVSLHWRPVDGDCDNVLFTLRTSRYAVSLPGDDCFSVDHLESVEVFSASRNWYLTSATRSVTITPRVGTPFSITVTIELCDWTTDEDITALTPEEVILTPAYTNQYAQYQSWPGTIGNQFCSLSRCNGNWGTRRVDWVYDSLTDEVHIRIVHLLSGDEVDECVTVPFDNGDWINNLDTIDFEHPNLRLVKIDACGDEPPPPEDCESYLCYPLCVANVCPSDPETVNASAVFITANDGAVDHDGTATWSDITSEYSFNFDVGVLCGTLSGRIYCDGDDIKVDFDLFDGVVHTYATFTVTWVCVDGDVSWTTPTAVSGATCSLDITLWTNNVS